MYQVQILNCYWNFIQLRSFFNSIECTGKVQSGPGIINWVRLQIMLLQMNLIDCYLYPPRVKTHPPPPSPTKENNLVVFHRDVWMLDQHTRVPWSSESIWSSAKLILNNLCICWESVDQVSPCFHMLLLSAFLGLCFFFCLCQLNSTKWWIKL